jgi:predicted AAA+ superfamily ATPase
MIEDLYLLSQSFLKNYSRPYKRYFLKRYTMDNRFSIIVGHRGVGKTTALIQYMLSECKNKTLTREVLYVQADHFIVGKQSLYDISEAFVKEGGKLICFDEIHKYPDWSRELKSISDTFQQIKIITSGSSALEIHKGAHDLSRRAIIYRMFEMSFREFLELSLNIKLESFKLEKILKKSQTITETIIKKLEEKKSRVLPLFRRYLQHGYYPYFNDYKNIGLFYITLEQNLHRTVESDLLAVFPQLSGSSINKIKKLISFIAKSVPFTPDLKKIKRLLEIGDERTLKNYLKYLEDAGIILTVSKQGKGLRMLEKPGKIYLNNPNLVYAIGDIENINKGSLRESFFANSLTGDYQVTIPDHGDFLVDGKYTFEVGGRSKDFKQIRNLDNSYLAVDDIEFGTRSDIPLWLFGFLY